MHVVPAGMHHGDVAACVVFGMDFARVGESGLFFYGERVEFGTKHDSGPGTVLEDGYNSSATDSFGDFIAQGAETGGKLGGGLRLVRGKFGILMEVEVELVGRGIDGIYLFGCQRLRVAGNRQRYEEKERCRFHGHRMIASDARDGKAERN